MAIDIGDFQLAACRGLHLCGDIKHAVVIEIEAGDGIARLGLGWFFLDADGATRGVELDHAIAFGVVHGVGEHRGAVSGGIGAFELHGQVMTIEDVVTQHQGRGGRTDEIAADDEGLGQAIGRGLHGVLQIQPPLTAITQQLFEAWCVLGGRNQQYVAYPRQHQRRQRVVDHGLVIHRQELLGHGNGDRMQARAGAAGEDDGFACHEMIPWVDWRCW